MADVVVPAPRWVAPFWEFTEGRDPLGMMTTTTDRLLPRLLPGLIELSDEARYFSFYAFLLAEYARRRLPGTRRALDRFIRRAEWDYALAVLRCPRCYSGPQGAQRVRPIVARQEDDFPRGESVQSTLGGYGLYYRSPMSELGLVAREGTPLGDEPLPIDVLAQSSRARALADAFRAAVADTSYVEQGWLLREEPLPGAVVDGYAEVGCLCRLAQFPGERDAVQQALFGSDPGDSLTSPAGGLEESGDEGPARSEAPEPSAAEAPAGPVAQRNRSVAHFLTLIEADPRVVESSASYRQALWSAFEQPSLSPAHRRVAGQWAALVAKDVWQEALCSVWSTFCRAGLDRARALRRPLEPEEVEETARAMSSGTPPLGGDVPAASIAEAVVNEQFSLPAANEDGAGEQLAPAALGVEALRGATERLDSATSGLIVALELARRVADRSGPGWDQAVQVRSAWQPAVGDALEGLRTRVDAEATVADMLWWLTSQFVLPVHTRIAYSKLPQRAFTFRFRWENGRLRFYDHGIGRFPLAAARHRPLRKITGALGLWDTSGPDGAAAITPAGRAFIEASLVP